MNSKLTGKALVVQLSSLGMRVACMSLGKTPKLRGSTYMPLPEGSVEDGSILQPEAVEQQLKAVMDLPEFRHVKKVIFTLCSTQVLSEAVTVRSMNGRRSASAVDDKMMEKTLDTNRDVYFPVDTRNCRLVWTGIGPAESEDGSPARAVQLWAVPNTLIAGYYSLANACGLTVVAVDYCGNSFAGAAGASFAVPTHHKKKKEKKPRVRKSAKAAENADADGPTAVLTEDIDELDSETVLYLLPDEDFLLMTFVRDGQILRQRILSRGAQSGDELEDARMVLELYKTERLDSGHIRAVVCGAGAQDRSYIRSVEDILYLPAEGAEGPLSSVLCLCTGAAATRLDFGGRTLNFPGKQSFVRQFWQYGLVAVCAAALVGAIVMYFGASTSWGFTLGGLEDTQQRLTLELAQVSGYADNWDNYEVDYNKYANDWEMLLGTVAEDGTIEPGILRTYNDNLYLILEELEGILPTGSSVVEIGIAPQGVALRLSCENKLQAAYLILALRSMQYGEEPIYISNLAVGQPYVQGERPMEVLSLLIPSVPTDSGDTEAPPTEGSSQSRSSAFAGSGLTNAEQDELAAISEKVSAGKTLTDDELNRTKTLIRKAPEEKRRPIALALCEGTSTDKYALGALLDRATVSQRRTAFGEMMENPFALYLFAELAMDDPDMLGTIMGFCFVHQDLLPEGVTEKIMALMPQLVAGNANAMNELIPEFENMDTKDMHAILNEFIRDDDNLAKGEALVIKDAELSKVHAFYLMGEMQLDPGGGSIPGASAEPSPDPDKDLRVVPGDSSVLYDPENEEYVDKESGEYVDRDSGDLFDLRTKEHGLIIDRKTKRLLDPETREPIDPKNDPHMALYTWEVKKYIDERGAAQGFNSFDIDWDKIDWTVINWRKMSKEEIIEELKRQALDQLWTEPEKDPKTGLEIDRETGLLHDPKTGAYIDPQTGRMMDKNGKPVDPLTIPTFAKLAQSLNAFGIDAGLIDWSGIDWRELDWTNLMSMPNIAKIAAQVVSQQTGGSGGLELDAQTGLLHDSRTGLYVDPNTGRLVDRNGDPIDPQNDPAFSQFLPMLEQFLGLAGVDAGDIDWSRIDWRNMDWSDPASNANIQELLRQAAEQSSGSSGLVQSGDIYVDRYTGHLMDSRTGLVVNPATDSRLSTLVNMLGQVLAQGDIDINSVNWNNIDWRGINISNIGRDDLINLVQQIMMQQGMTGEEFPGEFPGEIPEPDTHIYFTVAIPYKEALLKAELERKGLSEEDMREKLILEGEQ